MSQATCTHTSGLLRLRPRPGDVLPPLTQANHQRTTARLAPSPRPLPRLLTPAATSQTRAQTPIPTRAHRASPGPRHQNRAGPEQPSPAALAVWCCCVPRTPSAWHSQICGLGPLTALQSLAPAPTQNHPPCPRAGEPGPSPCTRPPPQPPPDRGQRGGWAAPRALRLRSSVQASPLLGAHIPPPLRPAVGAPRPGPFPAPRMQPPSRLVPTCRPQDAAPRGARRASAGLRPRSLAEPPSCTPRPCPRPRPTPHAPRRPQGWGPAPVATATALCSSGGSGGGGCCHWGAGRPQGPTAGPEITAPFLTHSQRTFFGAPVSLRPESLEQLPTRPPTR